MAEADLPALLQSAAALQAAGRLADAERVCREILRRNPDSVGAMRLLGAMLGQSGRAAEAVEPLTRCVELHPNDAVARSSLGAALQTLGRSEAAIEHLRRAVELRPDAAPFHYNLGKALREDDRLEPAREAFQRTVDLEPGFAAAWNNLGTTLRDLSRPREAIACLERALRLRPNHVPTLHNLGLALRDAMRLDDALRCFDTALAFDPGHVECRVARAMLLLLRGEFIRGWREYEARAELPGRPNRGPIWDGLDPEGRTIFLRAEQGLGDAIQFVRYAPLLAERGARVIVECRPVLKDLFHSLRGVERIVSTGDEAPAFDEQCGLLSMPMLFGTTLETVPADVPYLSADSADVRRRRRIIPPGGLRVGIVRAGAAGYGDDRKRSLSPVLLAPLAAVPDVRFYSLRKNPPGESSDLPSELKAIDLSAELHSFADTAAMIANLDLVISADTSVAHLAGATGRPVWVMLPFSPDWRWMIDRADSPWYPTMRLFRQPAPGDWDAVIAEVARELRVFTP